MFNSYMYNTVFYVIVGIIVFSYLLNRFLNYLNARTWSDKLPSEVADVYDSKEYKRSQDYKRVNDRFSLLTGTFSFLLIIFMFVSGGFRIINDITGNISEHPIIKALLFFGILMFASDLINIPFSLYDIFVIEEKFGFNKTTPKTFILDKLKSWMLALIIGGGLLSLIIWFYLKTQEHFWILAWIAVSLFTMFMYMFYATLIVPLFNKQTPLEDGELRDAIEKFSDKVKFKLDNIFVIDGSKRSTKANAYFMGLGSKKRIVLYDTLIRDLTKEEIVAVIGHEIGHYKKRHIRFNLVISVLQTGITLFIFSLLVDSWQLSQALGAENKEIVFHFGMIAFGIIYSPISLIVGLVMNIFSRKHEYSADKFTKENYKAEKLISSLKKITSKNLSNLTPHPVYVFFHYSHPTLLQRIRNLKGKK